MQSTIPTRRELIAWALAVVLAVSGVVLARADGAGAGATGPTTEVVYIATGANFPDALGAAATAAMGLGPVLLVQQDAVPAATLLELNRLQPPRIVIVGGTAVISDGVRLTLAGLPFSPEVTRIAGANRFETAAELSAATFPTSGMYPRAEFSSVEILDFGDGSVHSLVSVTIEAPAAGILLIDAGGDFSGGPDDFACWLEVDGETVPNSARVVELAGDPGTGHEVCSTQGGATVAAGAHTVEFMAEFSALVGINRASINVLWVPFDGTGAIPMP